MLSSAEWPTRNTPSTVRYDTQESCNQPGSRSRSPFVIRQPSPIIISLLPSSLPSHPQLASDRQTSSLVPDRPPNPILLSRALSTPAPSTTDTRLTWIRHPRGAVANQDAGSLPENQRPLEARWKQPRQPPHCSRGSWKNGPSRTSTGSMGAWNIEHGHRAWSIEHEASSTKHDRGHLSPPRGILVSSNQKHRRPTDYG